MMNGFDRRLRALEGARAAALPAPGEITIEQWREAMRAERSEGREAWAATLRGFGVSDKQIAVMLARVAQAEAAEALDTEPEPESRPEATETTPEARPEATETEPERADFAGPRISKHGRL